VGEIWHEASAWLRGDRFDAVMNYPFSRSCLGFFGGPSLDVRAKPGGYTLAPMDVAAFAEQVEQQQSMYEWAVVQSQLNLLGSHDTPRFLTMIGGNTERMKMAILFQMTAVGAPCIYYGDEIGMTGGPDPDCRRAMPWDEQKWDAKLLDYVKICTTLRQAHPALRRGTYTRLLAKDGVYSYGRRLNDQTAVVVINNGDHAFSSPVPVGGYLADGTVLRAVLSADQDAVVADGHINHAKIPALSGVVFVSGRSA